MNRHLRSALFAGLLALGLPALADDLPREADVAAAIHDGRFSEAQAMLDKVLAAKPNNARAHFVEAELLVREGRAEAAEQELATAERLQPGLPFVPADNVRNLRLMIAERSAHGASVQRQAQFSAPAPAESHFPWGVVLLIGGAGLLLWMILRARMQAPVQVITPAPGGAGGAYPYGTPYGGGPYGGPGMGGGMGSGIVGGLATGAAIGAGMVAGEALAHEFMGSGRRDVDTGYVPDNGPRVTDDSGQNFGMSDSGWGGDSGGIADSGGDGGGGGDWG